MDLNFKSVLLAIFTFLIIGLCHPLVIKTEYYFGTRPLWIWLICGLAAVVGALFVSDDFISTLLAVFGDSLLWGIGELFSQKKRVERGWFPMNPKRKNEYRPSAESTDSHSDEKEER
jgi:hypothetical protein